MSEETEVEPAEEAPLALPPPADHRPGRGRLFLLLVGVRMLGWVAAWCGVVVSTLVAVQVLRFRPTTLEGLAHVALRGARPPTAAGRKLPEARNDRHRAARELVREGLMAGRGEKVYRRLLARTPDHEDYNLELGELLLERARYPEAAVYLDRATRVNPESGIAFARLAEAQIRLGQLEPGLRNRRKARELHVDLRKVDRHLFRLYQREKHFDQAIKFGMKADPEEEDAEIQHELARTYFEKGRPIRNSIRNFRWSWDEAAKAGAQRHVRRCLELDETHQGCLALKGKL